jgi:hypothetical protein
MRVNGEWYECDDGVTRAIVRAVVLGANGIWFPQVFLLDTGADRTVFSADLVSALGLEPIRTGNQLGGIGGTTEAVYFDTQIRLTHETGNVVVHGRYAGVTVPGVLDMSLLGQEFRQLFALIVDWPGKVVCLLHPPHHYRIEVAGA